MELTLQWSRENFNKIYSANFTSYKNKCITSNKKNIFTMIIENL